MTTMYLIVIWKEKMHRAVCYALMVQNYVDSSTESIRKGSIKEKNSEGQ